MNELLNQRTVMRTRLLASGVFGIALVLAANGDALAGLIARYTFEDTTVADHMVYDTAGSAVAHDMTFDSVVANSSDSKEGSKAGVFDGTANAHGYYQVTDAADPIRTEAFTICYWVKADSSNTTYMTPISWDDNRDKSPWVNMMAPGTGNSRLFMWRAGGGGSAAPFSVPMDEWVHLAISQGHGESGTEAQLYRNGQLIVQLTDLSTIPLTSTEHLRLGSFGGLYPLKGLLDDVQIYDSALTSQQIASLYQSYEVPEPSTVLLTISGMLMFAIVRLVRRRPAGLEKS